jgi:hypothetical protein
VRVWLLCATGDRPTPKMAPSASSFAAYLLRSRVNTYIFFSCLGSLFLYVVDELSEVEWDLGLEWLARSGMSGLKWLWWLWWLGWRANTKGCGRQYIARDSHKIDCYRKVTKARKHR